MAIKWVIAILIMAIIQKTLTPWGILLLGELFQNNHHHAKDSANFAQKWFEFDPAFQVMKVLNFVGIIKLKKPAPAVVAPPPTYQRSHVHAKKEEMVEA